MTSISFKEIHKRYLDHVAVKQLTLDVLAGEFLVLVGPSGCGKSTILRMVAGLEEITSGDLYFDAKRVNDLTPGQRDIGMVFQNYALYPHLNVGENIAFPLNIKRIPKSEITSRVNEVSQMLGLQDLLNRKPKELSGGQRQRVALGRAIARKPSLYLFDEPLSNLDAKLRVQMRAEITSLQRKTQTTSIYVTHDQVEAMTMGDRIAVMCDGELMQIGTPEEIYSKPENVFVAGFMGSPSMNLFEGEISDDGSSFQTSRGGLKIRLTQNLPEKAKTLGIRPEDLAVAENGESNFRVKIIARENIGHESLVYFRSSDNSALHCLRSVGMSAGDELEVKVKGEVHCFGGDGVRILK